MARPINYIFCRYRISIGDEPLDEIAQHNLLAENQGSEYDHGRLREGTQPQTLCTDPLVVDFASRKALSFQIGYKPGIRTDQRYDATQKKVVRRLREDQHTRFGHLVAIPSLGALAVRDRSTDELLPALQTLGALRSFILGATEREGAIDITHSTDDDLNHALQTWAVKEYSYTVRPVNPTGGDLALLRSEMHKSEGIAREVGKVKPNEGESLTMAEGIIGQTKAMADAGYGQIGIKGVTEDGHSATIPKATFSMSKEKNLAYREDKPRYLRIGIEQNDQDRSELDSILRALMRFFQRDGT